MFGALQNVFIFTGLVRFWHEYITISFDGCNKGKCFFYCNQMSKFILTLFFYLKMLFQDPYFYFTGAQNIYEKISGMVPFNFRSIYWDICCACVLNHSHFYNLHCDIKLREFTFYITLKHFSPYVQYRLFYQKTEVHSKTCFCQHLTASINLIYNRLLKSCNYTCFINFVHF